MQQIIKDNPDDMDAYMFINFLLMNLVVEEDYDRSKQDNYIALIKWYFDESYKKFSDNPEYLYMTAKTAVMCESFYGIDVEDYEQMIEKARMMDPNNLVYKESYYWDLQNKDPKDPELITYAKIVLSENSPVKQQLQLKGILGEYIWGMKQNFCKDILSYAEQKDNLEQ